MSDSTSCLSRVINLSFKFACSRYEGEAAWNGGKNVASFLGEQIYTAAVFAQPHLESMASSTANALKAAAEDSMDKIRGHSWTKTHDACVEIASVAECCVHRSQFIASAVTVL